MDVEGLLNDLERAILNVSRLVTMGGGATEETSRIGLGDKVSVRTTLRVGFLDEMLAAQASRPVLDREPMVDLIQTKEGFKVLVLLPGVKKEDIRFFAAPRSLAFEVTTRGETFRREIPCDVPPSKITIESVVENNSVVEVSFARKRRDADQ